jgi:hypothetical protein
MPPFVKGLDLSRRFYDEIVKAILERHDRELPYAAALIGSGSEVLGFDDAMSTDHDWGPSVTIFVRHDASQLVEVIGELMRHELPHQFMGYSTNYIHAPEAPGVQVMAITTRGVVNHRVQAVTIDSYFMRYLGWDVSHSIEAVDWLTFPSQKLRALTSGAVHHDGIGDLTHIRAALAWYPDEIWLYLMAAQWLRIGEEEHLMGRAGYAGDELGAALIGARLVQDMMRLCFLIERHYAPYPKWFGTAFRQLHCAGLLGSALRRIQLAETWQQREEAYIQAAEHIAAMHNDLNVTDKLSAKARRFHNRPFKVIDAGHYAEALLSRITDKELKPLFDNPSLLGSIDQFSDETGLRERSAWRERIRNLYLKQDA